MNKLFTSFAVALAIPCSLPATAFAAEPMSMEAAVKVGEEVEVTSGAVTALSCALEARDHGKLEALNACPLEEALKGIVVFDVEERQIYVLDAKKVRRYQLEKAFGGGSIDFTAVVKKVGKAGVADVLVGDFSVTPKPKPGAFKGCL